MEQETQTIPFGTKLAITVKFTLTGLAFALMCQGAVSMTHKQWVQVAMGSQAVASEVRADAYNRAENDGDLALKPAETLVRASGRNTDYIDSKAVAVPQDLEPIKIELTASEKAGLAKCKKTKPAAYCGSLWGV